MRSELIGLITAKGGNPDDSSTTKGAIHRTWIDIKNSFGRDHAESTLENVVFGEKAAIDAYQDALNSGDLCSESTAVVSDQLSRLNTSYTKFESLEKLAE